MGERGVRNAEARGSSPLISTKLIQPADISAGFLVYRAYRKTPSVIHNSYTHWQNESNLPQLTCQGLPLPFVEDRFLHGIKIKLPPGFAIKHNSTIKISISKNSVTLGRLPI
jgi:hypothetical protein